MDKDELDHQIDELDHRLDRLRSLYEQYFLGIERIEPAIARKDVDRRFWALRKVKIRNTARRFKLQTLIQRYNTFQQHWGRVCREIENGTYKRQLLRAERRQGPASTRARDSVLPPSSERADAARAAADAAAADLESLLHGDVDLAAEAKRALDAVLQTKPSPAKFKPDEAPTQPRAAMRSVAPLEKLELDDFDLGPASSPPARAPAARPLPAPPSVAAPAAGRPPAPRPPLTRPPPPLTRPPTPHRPPGAPEARPSAAPVARVALKQVAVPARGFTEVSPGPSNPRESARPSASQPLATKEQSATRGASPGTAPARPFRSAIGGSGRAADIFGSTPKAPATPAVAPKPAAPAARPAAAQKPAQPRPSAGLTEDRVKQLHAKLLATKSQLNDRGEVSVGGLQRQLAASYERLQTKHRGRQIDFDVVVKDGKAVLKPKIR